MALNPKAGRHVGRQWPTPPRPTKGLKSTPSLPLPQERDQSIHNTAKAPHPMMVQAKQDIDCGLVDTDMHATPGLDAQRRARLVTGPGGKPPFMEG